ncbi:MAG: hypothetical protein A3H51_02870 [Candidatus Spechtbacteria bacterium RIFCSPLOWO2_02_FULL_38_8]|uniref:SIMPL domain-containing protein n=1 Tax=Candidatus Spechtbacteria bacterium RIFCSPLOWO2_02_FULL_38_8 TaxID=1802164 RepID=A0A1G2HHE2_9BACT|nr:MAG: hypothetical protein A3H51_02870 [Candidatus Spechtbacteria bacterium RIFCSPLOWO2_02_FULL_38_8]
MNEKIKDLLGVLGIVFLATLSVSAFLFVRFVGRTSSTATPSFKVSAEGKVVAIPDVAEFTFGVVTEGGLSLGELQEENTEKINGAIDFLKESGVKDKDIKTQNYYVSPRYTYCMYNFDEICPPEEITGYVITQDVEVKVRELAKAGELIAGIVEHGANSVSQLSFKVDDTAELEAEAREQAMQKARDKAEATAKAGNFRLGRLLSVSENFDSPIQPMYYDVKEGGMGGGGSSPSIEPGSQEVVINVTLEYQIK